MNMQVRGHTFCMVAAVASAWGLHAETVRQNGGVGRREAYKAILDLTCNNS